MGVSVFCGKRTFLVKLFFVLVGFISGVCLYQITLGHLLSHWFSEAYNETLAVKLRGEIKIMCMIMTNPRNHRLKAIFVRDTWGKKCDKLMFITSQDDPELDTIVVDVVNDTRKALRRKAKTAYLYAHDNHIDDYDWFLKADDDNFVIMENLRYLLYQYHPQTSLFFGHRQIDKKFTNNTFYMSGAGYILSKKALEKLAKKIRARPTEFFYPDEEREDVEMGRALETSAIFVDCRDDLHRRRFLPWTFVLNDKLPKWYRYMTYYKAPNGAMKCCSDVPITFHYVNRTRQYLNQYLVYHVHPFGVDKNSTEILPRKLPLSEIISASDVKSAAKYYMKHSAEHQIDSSERYD